MRVATQARIGSAGAPDPPPRVTRGAREFLNQFWPATVDGLALGAIYALVALGYTMVYGVLRLINFAHSEVFMVGTVAALFTLTTIGVSGRLGGGAHRDAPTDRGCRDCRLWGYGRGLEYIAYRPLRKRGGSRLAALISAIGASLFLQQLFALIVIPGLFSYRSKVDAYRFRRRHG